MSLHNIPESGRVVGFDEVSKFVNDDVIDDEHRGFNQTPVNIDVIVWSAGTPAKAVVNDLDLGEINTEFTGMPLYPWRYLFLGLVYIPFP